jgi:hypothetical protein
MKAEGSAKHSLSNLSLRTSAFHALALLLLALAWTWPLVTRISWRIAHDPGDPVLNAWILWWNVQALPFTGEWWDAPIFYPMPGALALSEHLAGIAPFTAPLHAAGLTPIAAYNISLILSCWLSAWFAFLLGRRLTGSTAAGIIAGLAFGFAPYRAGQLAHLQVLTTQWMPLSLLAMHAYLDKGRRRWLAVFGLAWVLQALSNGYYLLFFPILIGLWLLWFVDWRRERRRGLVLAATFAGASLLLLPVLLQYKQVHEGLDLQRSIDEMRSYSASPMSFVQPAGMLAFWPAREGATPEGDLFPGVTTVALALLGLAALVWRRQVQEAVATRSPAVFYGLATMVLWWLCFGPAAEDASAWTHIRPYTPLMWLPGFDGLRVPARFAMLATLTLSMAAAIAAARLAPRGSGRRLAATAIVATALLVDGWIEPMPLVVPPQRVLIEAPEGAPVIELPPDDPMLNVAAMYRALSHGRPLVNGYSGHTPRHYDLLATYLHRRDPSILTHYARGTSLVVIVNRAKDGDREWRQFVESAGGRLTQETGVGPVYVLPPHPREKRPPLGAALATTSVEASDGFVTADLGRTEAIRALTVNLRWRYAEVGPRMLVETSMDGASWQPAWEGFVGEAALAGALLDQQVVPMTLYLPDPRARYLRLSHAPPWLARELTLRGAAR